MKIIFAFLLFTVLGALLLGPLQPKPAGTRLPRLCAASGVGARIATAALPLVRLSGKAQASRFDPLSLALNGGDDYELLFTVNPRNTQRLPRSFRGLPLTRIGEITRERELVFRDIHGGERPLLPRGWDPFRHPK